MRIPLTRYGLREIILGSVFFAAASLAVLCLWPPAAAATVLLWLGFLAFFRDPERQPPKEADMLLSPADGVVRDVAEVESPGPFLQGPAVRIGVFMSVFNVHVNRSPAAGTVRWVQHTPGRYLDARDGRASAENEHNFLGMELDGGRKILVNQIAGAVARRIICAARPGQSLRAGERFGMIKLGSRLELFVPTADEHTVTVKPGDKVRAGRDALVRYGRKESA